MAKCNTLTGSAVKGLSTLSGVRDETPADNDFSAFYSVRVRTPIVANFTRFQSSVWNKEPDRVGRCRLCAAPK